jgi:hypothetical protein
LDIKPGVEQGTQMGTETNIFWGLGFF